jgi:hypothetical protein
MSTAITWIAETRGWTWRAYVDGVRATWEVVRTVRPDDGKAQFAILHGTNFVDFRYTAEGARLAAESEITRTTIEVQR